MDTIADYLRKLWFRISSAEKAAFISASLIGFLAHVTFMTNRFFNHDSILYTIVDPNSTFILQQGKWLNLFAQRLIQGDLTTAGIMVPVAILLLALTAAFSVSILKVKSPVWASAIGAFLVLFPSVMCANIYLSSAIFFSALLLATLGVFFTLRSKHGYLLGILLLTMSCGVYSVFIGYAAGLFVLSLLLALIEEKLSVKDALLKGLKYVAVLCISAVLYYVVLQVLLRIRHVSLMSYRGIESIGSFSLNSIGNVLYEAYQKVYYFLIYGIFLYRGNFTIEPMFRYLNWASLAVTAILCCWMLIKRRLYLQVGRLALILALVLVFPFAIHAIAILGQNAYTHWIMCYPFVLVYVALTASADLAERSLPEKDTGVSRNKIQNALLRSGLVLVLLVSILLSRQWFFTTNQAYEYIRFQDENTVSTGILLASDIRNSDGYSKDVPVAFVGSSAPSAFQYRTSDFSVIHGKDGIGYTGYNGAIVDNERLKMLYRNWIGISYNYADAALVTKLSQDPNVIGLPIYPEHGSIVMIDGVLVVKLSDCKG